MDRHEHNWIDITYLGSESEHRLCVTCNQEERRLLTALALSDGSLADDDWKLVRQGAGRRLVYDAETPEISVGQEFTVDGKGYVATGIVTSEGVGQSLPRS